MTGQQLASGEGEAAPPLQSAQADPTPRARVAGEPEAPGPPARTETKSTSLKSHSPAIPLRDDGHTELVLAQQYLRGAGGREDRATATDLLWVAVGKGNTEAEIELASLYLPGDDGSGKNCEQARILLRAASNNGNSIAGQKLATLPVYGCN